jgi:hypothetical protein
MAQIVARLAISVIFLVIAVFRIAYPKVTIDTFIAFCLVGVATPWLLPKLHLLISKLPRITKTKLGTGGVEVEFESGKSDPPAQPVPNAVTERRAAPARIRATTSRIGSLAEDGERTIVAFRDGGININALVNLVVQISGVVDTLSGADVAHLLNGTSGGERLIAYVRLRRFPDAAFAPALVRALVAEENAFGQWWCIQALRRLHDAAPQDIAPDEHHKLKGYLRTLPQSSDRHRELCWVVRESEADPGEAPSRSGTACTQPEVMQGS